MIVGQLTIDDDTVARDRARRTLQRRTGVNGGDAAPSARTRQRERAGPVDGHICAGAGTGGVAAPGNAAGAVIGDPVDVGSHAVRGGQGCGRAGCKKQPRARSRAYVCSARDEAATRRTAGHPAGGTEHHVKTGAAAGPHKHRAAKARAAAAAREGSRTRADTASSGRLGPCPGTAATAEATRTAIGNNAVARTAATATAEAARARAVCIVGAAPAAEIAAQPGQAAAAATAAATADAAVKGVQAYGRRMGISV